MMKIIWKLLKIIDKVAYVAEKNYIVVARMEMLYLSKKLNISYLIKIFGLLYIVENANFLNVNIY